MHGNHALILILLLTVASIICFTWFIYKICMRCITVEAAYRLREQNDLYAAEDGSANEGPRASGGLPTQRPPGQ